MSESMINPLFVVDKGSYLEVIRGEDSLFMCPFCGEFFRGLAYHTRQVHGVSGKRLRRLLGVKYNYRLVTDDLSERHREIVFDNVDSHINHNLLRCGEKTRYRKGSKGHVKGDWSPQALVEKKLRVWR